MEFGLLGPLEVWDGGRKLPLGGAKQRALLADLVIHANEVVSADRLIDDLWGDRPPETAANALQTYVAQLRKVLEPERQSGAPGRVLQTVAPGYVLKVGPDQLDAVRFEERLTSGREMLNGNPSEAAVVLREALSLWRGPAIADVADAAFAQAEAARLEDLRIIALEERIQAELALGRHRGVIGELQILVAKHPFRERLCGQLMLALYRSGRQAEASAVYQQTRQRLAEELGIDPGADLQKLLNLILNQDAALNLERPAAVEFGPTNLPLQLTSFVGRELEVTHFRELIASHRLLTLIGTGGVGKTRLALEVAGGLQRVFPDGVWYVELASLTDPTLVPQALASVLRIQEQTQRLLLETVIEVLRKRHVLVVLDNCEHLVDACAKFVGALLQSCPNLHILATSRERLRVSGETARPVQPLVIPQVSEALAPETLANNPSVRLFAHRAAAVRADFVLDDRNAAAVAQVCRSLDGIPLALELAAALHSSLSMESIAQRLDRRIHLLAAGSRTAPSRQRTLRATIDWSYDLLDPSERVLFARLSAFAGGWSLEAAESVCADCSIPAAAVVSLLAHLADKSLIMMEPIEASAFSVTHSARYRLLETVREYACERFGQSGEAELIHRRHADYMLALANTAGETITGQTTRRWLVEMEREHDNLRSALNWSESADAQLALRLATACAPFWLARGHFSEGRQWLIRALSAAPADTPGRARCCLQAARLAFFQGDLSAARDAGTEGLSIAQRLAELDVVAPLLLGLGICARLEGNHQAGRAFLEDSLQLSRQLGDQIGEARALSNLAASAAAEGDFVAAREQWNHTLALAQGLEHWEMAIVLQGLGHLDLQDGQLDAAQARFRDSLLIAGERGDPRWIAEGLDCFARLAASYGDARQSLQLAAAAEACREAIGVKNARSPFGWWDIDFAGELQRMRVILGQVEAKRAWAEGRAMTTEEAVACALADDKPTRCDKVRETIVSK